MLLDTIQQWTMDPLCIPGESLYSLNGIPSFNEADACYDEEDPFTGAAQQLPASSCRTR